MNNIGIQIRDLRKTKGLSQSKLSKLLNVSPAMFSAWELGKIPIDETRLANIKDLINNINDENLEKLKKKKTYKRNNGPVSNKGSQNISEIPKNFPLGNPFACQSWNKYRNSINIPLMKDIPHIEKKYSAISLFSGCGGFSLGFNFAGFTVKGFVEIVDSASRIYSLNFPFTEHIGKDVREITEDQIKKWKDTYGEVDVLFGGPPCQGFSLAGKRDINDERNNLFKQFARIAKFLQPKIVVMENVRLMLSMRSMHNSHLADDIIKEFNSANYFMKYQHLNAINFGAPQSRERVFFVGLRKDIQKNFEYPLPTHSETSETSMFNTTKKIVTFYDACSSLESLESGEHSTFDPYHFAPVHPQHVIDMLKGIPEGMSAHNNPDPNLRPSSGFNTTYKRLIWNEPASTISTNFGMISGSRNVHPTNTRALTIREAMRCQTFPDDFKLVGNLGDVRTAIGNAVPPLLSYNIAKSVKEFLDKI